MATLLLRRVWIERSECIGHTLCIPEAPNLIEHDRDAGASVIEEGSPQRTQQELKELLEAAVTCPMNAFYLETPDGSTLCLDNELIACAIRQGDYCWA